MVDKEGSADSERLITEIKMEIEGGSQIFLDYDGTLVPIIIDPEKCYAPQSLREILFNLSKKYELYIVSGRQIKELKDFIGLDINLIGMHGAVAYLDGREIPLVKDFYQYASRIEKVKEMNLQEKYDGLRVYDKSSGILFHLGLVNKNLWDKIRNEIESIALEYNMELYYGKQIIELKIPGVNKGDAIRRFRNGKPCLIAGDEDTDESGFIKCPECLSIHVGEGNTHAKYRVKNVEEFLSILKALS